LTLQLVIDAIYSEDMVRLLGKRPFVGRSDDMDKWLDENQHRGEKSAPPPMEDPQDSGRLDDPIPQPALTKALDQTRLF
jgi:AFG3 family protein